MTLPALDPLAALVLRIDLGLLFVVAAGHKFAAPAHFRAALAGYRLLPAPLLAPVARALPLCEAGAGLGLWLSPMQRAPALLGAGLLAIYSAAIALELQRGRASIDCGCLGPGRPRGLGADLLVRNALLVALLVLLVALPVAPRSIGWVDALAAAAGALAGALLYAGAEQATLNHSRWRRPSGGPAWNPL